MIDTWTWPRTHELDALKMFLILFFQFHRPQQNLPTARDSGNGEKTNARQNRC